MLRKTRSIEELSNLVLERDSRVHCFGLVNTDGWNVGLHVTLLEQRRAQSVQQIDIKGSFRHLRFSAYNHQDLRPDRCDLLDLDQLNVPVLEYFFNKLWSGDRQSDYRSWSITNDEGR